MKNILIKLLLIISLLWISNIWNTYASDWASSNWTIKTSISMDFWKILKDSCWWEKWNYYCNVPKWIWLITFFLWKMIKFITYIAALWSVLFIIVNGIMYSMWWLDPSFKDDAKKRIIWTLSWLVLLLSSWVILNLVAPWIYK
jgi:hypothetical protein